MPDTRVIVTFDLQPGIDPEAFKRLVVDRVQRLIYHASFVVTETPEREH